MHGIDYVLDSNHIKRDNIGLAVQAVNSLNISLNTVNHFIAETIEHDFDETVPVIDDLDQARATLALIVQTGLKQKVQKFSLDAFAQFSNRAKSIQRENVPNPQPVSITPAMPKPVQGNIPVQSTPAPVTIAPKPVAPVITRPKPVENTPVKGKRNRKANPNSNLSRAKNLYTNSSDKTRDTIVALFQKELGIEQGTATTYYYLAKKG